MINSKTIILAFPLGNSAVSDYFKSLSAELVSRGYLVIILTSGRTKEPQSINPLICYWPSIRPTHWQDALLLAKIIRRHKPVLVLANFGAVNTCILTSYLMGVPIRLARYHTSFDVFQRLNYWGRFVEKFKVMRKSYVYRFATMLLPVAESMSIELEKIYQVPRKKIKTFHNALIDLRIVGTHAAIAPDKLICAGRLTFGKGQDVLIQALHLVINKFPDVKLQLIGNGASMKELSDLAEHLALSSSVDFVGSIPHEQVFSRMAEACAVVVPSRFEACPYVVIEAMSVGIPVIASAVGGIPELIRDGVDGFLVPPENPEILAERIMALLDDRELQKTMGKNARDRFLNEFELRKAVMNEADWIESQIHQMSSN